MQFISKLVLTGLLLISSAVFAADDPIFTGTWSSDAIRGYDTVAYFTEGKAVDGSDKFTAQWGGETWRFANQKHLDLFNANPEQYLPQYGGWCAYAMSDGRTAGIEPDAFTIHNGKLYLNYNQSVMGHWRKEQDKFIHQADGHYPKVVDLSLLKK